MQALLSCLVLISHALFEEELANAFNSGNHDAAFKVLERAIKVEPGNIRNHLNKGGILLMNGRTNEAEAAFVQATKIDPDSPLPFVHLSEARGGDAKALFAAVSAKPTEEYMPYILNAASTLGALLHDRGQLEEARTQLQRVFDAGLAMPTDLVNLAEVSSKQNRKSEAVPLLQRAMVLASQGAQVDGQLAFPAIYESEEEEVAQSRVEVQVVALRLATTFYNLRHEKVYSDDSSDNALREAQRLSKQAMRMQPTDGEAHMLFALVMDALAIQTKRGSKGKGKTGEEKGKGGTAQRAKRQTKKATEHFRRAAVLTKEFADAQPAGGAGSGGVGHAVGAADRLVRLTSGRRKFPRLLQRLALQSLNEEGATEGSATEGSIGTNSSSLDLDRHPLVQAAGVGGFQVLGKGMDRTLSLVDEKVGQSGGTSALSVFGGGGWGAAGGSAAGGSAAEGMEEGGEGNDGEGQPMASPLAHVDRILYSSRCDVDRRDASRLTAQEFHEEYVDLGKPVLLFGEGLVRGRAWQAWRRQDLLDAHGEAWVNVSRSSAIVLEQAHGAQGKGLRPKVQLKEYIAQMVDGSCTANETGDDTGDDTGDPLYLFKSLHLPGIQNDILPPALLFDDASRFSWSDKEREDHALFFLGPRYSGAYFHIHGTFYIICLFLF
jgi:Flp pilus assembly protein TadD